MMDDESRNTSPPAADAAQKFDFDTLSELAARDPDAFEHRRRELVEAFIATVPAKRRPRLHSLQWRLDHLRDSRPPLGVCWEFCEMMWDRLYGNQGLMDFIKHGPELVLSYSRDERVHCLFGDPER